MVRFHQIFALAVGCLLTLAPMTAGAADQIGSVMIKRVEAQRYQKLALQVDETVPRGYLRMMNAAPGQLFLVVRMELIPTMAKDEDGDEVVQIEDEDVLLIDGGGTKYPNLGRCTRDGRFSEYETGYYLYSKSDREFENFDLVFLVPAQQKKFTVQMGNAKQEFMVPPQAEVAIDPAQVAEFTITSAKVVSELAWKEKLGPYNNIQGEVENRVQSTTDKFLVVRIVVKPKLLNSENSFNLNLNDIGVLLGRQVYIAPMGQVQNGDFSPYTYGDSEEPDAAGQIPAMSATVVYPLPGQIKQFKLLYMTRPVADGKLGSAG